MENKKYDSRFSIGSPSSLPGGDPYSSKSAEILTEIQPDKGHNMRIGNQIEGNNRRSLPDNDPYIDQELYEARYSGAERIMFEHIESGNPLQLAQAVSLMEEALMDSNTPNGLDNNRFELPREVGHMKKKAQALGTKITRLQLLGIIKDYDPVNGTATVIDIKQAANYGFDVSKIDRDTRGVEVGTEEERAILKEIYNTMTHSFEGVFVLNSISGLMGRPDLRDSLEDLVTTTLTRSDKLMIDHLKALGNRPSIAELASLKKDNLKEVREMHAWSDDWEASMVLIEGMLHSGEQGKMLDFLNRPRVKEIMNKKGWTIDKIFGRVDKWVGDDKRTDESNIEERKNGLRGTEGESVAWLGNMVAYISEKRGSGSRYESLTSDMENDFVGKIAKLVGCDVQTVWIAVDTLKGLGEFDSKGYVRLGSGRVVLPLGSERAFSATDRQKYLINARISNELAKGRPGSTPKMLGRMPDMLLSLFERTQVYQKGVGWLNIMDAWLGIQDGKLKDFISGLEVDGTSLPKHTGQRFGEIDFGSMNSGFHHTHELMDWLLGREGGGLQQWFTKTEWKQDEFSIKQFLAAWKYLSIGGNAGNMAEGTPYRYAGFNNTEYLKYLYKSWLVAVIESPFFVENLLTAKAISPTASIDARDYQIPFIREMIYNFDVAMGVINAGEDVQKMQKAWLNIDRDTVQKGLLDYSANKTETRIKEIKAEIANSPFNRIPLAVPKK